MKSPLPPMLLLVALAVISLCCGAYWLPPAEFHSPEGWHPVFVLRFQRVITAITVGGSLALSGLILQAVLRNPLAEPFTLGLSGGASVGAALAFILGFYTHSVFAVPLGATIGALLVLGLVLWISKFGKHGSESLLLSGVIAGTIASSILMYIVSIAHNEELAGITWWTLGDLQGTDPRLLWPGATLLCLALPVLLFNADKIDAISLGDDQAFYLGGNPRLLTVLLILIASFLAASTVAMAGIVSFCGLVVPHIVRRTYGGIHQRILLPTAAWGAVFLLLCDLLSRSFYLEREIPIGVMTAFIGGPIFLWLLNKSK